MKRCIGCKEQYEENLTECPHCGYSLKKTIEGYFLKPGALLYFDRYEIGNVLGQGGFGITYIAWDNISEKKVSIKEYFPSEFSSRSEGSSQLSIYSGNREKGFRDGLSCFMDEARKLAKLSQIEGIIKILECFEENNTAYIVMEYLEGESLAQKLEREGKMEPQKAVDMLMPIMESLVKVHNEGIIHRDIAPDNIFVLNDGTARLLDFGASRQAIATESQSLTVIVKAGYSPEEQYTTHGEQGPWTDVYSMAATLYRMITGIKPVDAAGRRNQIVNKNDDGLLNIEDCNVKVEKNISTAITRAMQLAVVDRTQNMQALIEELQKECDRKKLICIIEYKRYIIFGAISLIFILVIFTITYKMNCIPGKVFRNDINNIQKENIVKNDEEEKKASEKNKMPLIVNLSLDEASKLLSEIGLKYVIVDYIENVDLEENTILSQNIEPEKSISENSCVEITVSCKKKNLEVVNVIGKDENEAKNELEKMGFIVQIVYSYNKDSKDNIVLSQTPETGIMACSGCVVIINVNNEKVSEDIQKQSATQKANITKASVTPLATKSATVSNQQENNVDNSVTNITSEVNNSSKNVSAQSNLELDINYQAYFSESGWSELVSNGDICKAVSSSDKIEAIKIIAINSKGETINNVISCKAHIQNDGWISAVTNGVVSGIEGSNKRLEAINLCMADSYESTYNIYYRVCTTNFGWTGWARNNEDCGTSYYEEPLNAIQILINNKNDVAPGSIEGAYRAYKEYPLLSYKRYSTSTGWSESITDTKCLGSENDTNAFQAIDFDFTKAEADISSKLSIRIHTSDIGWSQEWLSAENVIGTTTSSNWIEAIAIKLSDDYSKDYDVYYRVYSKDTGWLGWTKNGNPAGTTGASKAILNMEVRIIKKGAETPNMSKEAYVGESL